MRYRCKRDRTNDWEKIIMWNDKNNFSVITMRYGKVDDCIGHKYRTRDSREVTTINMKLLFFKDVVVRQERSLGYHWVYQ